MRIPVLLIGAVLLQASPAWPQSAPLGTGLNGGIGSSLEGGLQGGIQSGLYSGLAAPEQRTLADRYNQFGTFGAARALGNECPTTQADPDRKGCRPIEDLRRESPDPNRIVNYTGDSAFRPTNSNDPNRPF